MKTAIVTGASSGIGLAIAQTLAKHNYAIVANSRSISESHPAIQHINANHIAISPGDIANPTIAKQTIDIALQRFNQIDLLVNNAGIFIPKPFTDYTPDDFHSLITTNLHGFFYISQLAARHFTSQKAGHIVNITTSLAENPLQTVPSSLPILTKAGLNGVTKALALELAPSNTRVNAISPGIIDTPMHANADHTQLASLHPLNRLGQPQEIANALLFLEQNQFITGEILHIDGGAHTGRW